MNSSPLLFFVFDASNVLDQQADELLLCSWTMTAGSWANNAVVLCGAGSGRPAPLPFTCACGLPGAPPLSDTFVIASALPALSL